MTKSEREAWQESNDRISARVAGGEKALEALLEKATKLLQERAGNSDITKGLLGTAVIHDAVLLRMIVNHGDALQLLAKKYGKK
jgi:hypothetical protein